MKTHSRPGIPSHWQLNNTYRKKCKKTSKFHTTVPLWEESTGDQWTRPITGQWCKSINHAISGLQIYFCFISVMEETLGNSDIAWVSVDYISLATLQFVQQIIPENKNKKKKDTMLHSTDHPSGGKSLVNNGISTQGSELRKFFIMQCQDYQSTFMSSFQKDKLCTQQWQQLSVLGFHLTGRYIVGSTAVSHYWSFMRRIHWWPMDSPHQGPTKRNTSMCNSQSTFASSILCNIKQYFHHSDVICASWASPSLATLMFVHQPVHKNTKENNKGPHRWFPVRRNQQRPMESPHKGPAMWEALIMQFQYFRSTYDGKTHFTQQWKHMHVLGFHLTGNYIVY